MELEHVYDGIASIGRRLGAERVMLYGSRARGDARTRSDIDIAVFGLPAARQGVFHLAAEELPTLLKLDIAFIRPGTDPAFLGAVEKEGIMLYEKGR